MLKYHINYLQGGVGIMKAGRFRSIWIVAASFGLIIYYSVKTLTFSLFNALTREKIDRWTPYMAQKLLDLPNVELRVNNPHQVDYQAGEPYILMSNHSSLYDIPVVLLSLPGSIRMLTKKELCKIPLWGAALIASEFVSIDRKNRTQAIKDLAIAQEKMKSGIHLWIAPEGTRSKNGKLQDFKKGGFITAIQAGAKIIPMGINGAFDVLPPKTTAFNLHQQVEVNIGEVIDASQYTLDERDQLMALTRERIAALLN